METISIIYRCWINETHSVFPIDVMVNVDSAEEVCIEIKRGKEDYLKDYIKVDLVDVVFVD